MVHHHLVRRPHNRRADDSGLLNTPTAAGLVAPSVAAGTAATGATLAIDSDAANGNTADVVQFSAVPTNTFTSTSPVQSPTGSSDESSSSTASAAASTPEISIGTVIGACLGALAGAIVIILIGLWLYRRGTQPRKRSPSNAHRAGDKERAWAKMQDDEDKWEGKDGKYQQKGIVSVGPMEKLTMFKKSTPSMHTTEDHESLPTIAPFSHPFAQYHPNLAKELAQDHATVDDPPRRPFLARVDPIAPISWDGDTVARDSFLSLTSNPAMSPGVDMAIPTPKLTSSEPHHWQSAEVINFEDDDLRGRSDATDPPRKSANNPFFGARMSVHSTHSRSRSQSRSRTPSISAPSRANAPDLETMPQPPPSAYTREEKGKYRAATPPSPASSRAPSTIIAHNPFSDPVDPIITPIVPFKPEHVSKDSQDRAMASLLVALGPTATLAEAQERLRVASMMSESQYTETDGDDATLHQSWPVPPSRP